MDNNYKKFFGNNLRTLREQQHITQEQLSAKLQLSGCDITRSALAKMEVGQRHIYPDEILKIKEVLNVSFDDLFYGC
ncbi:MAG: helix-turn-helix domain-containing protein [Lentihominibacter sp.]